MNKKRYRSSVLGLTLPEIVIVLVMAVPLFVIIGTIFFNTFSYWKKGKDRILVEQDIRFFRRRFEKSLRLAPDIEVPNPQLVRLGLLTPGAKREEYEYDSVNKTAVYRNLDAGTSEAVARDVSALSWVIDTSESIRTRIGIVRRSVSGESAAVISSTVTFISASRNIP
ncbi:MAG TPA: hypothetical protein VJC03_07970 [bacterium]|nr:hypothetical protein [bacterium]